jgi:hypothetical protein
MKPIKLKKIAAVIASLLVFATAAFSQAAIKTKNGFLFVNNDSDKSFTLEISGKEVKTLESEQPMFSVDGRLLQILVVPKTDFVKNDAKMSDEQLLEAHKTWESDYLTQEIFETKLSVESENVVFGDRKALFWGFVRPKHNEYYKNDYFLTTIIGSNLLALGSPIEGKQTKADAQKFLTDLMKTLKVSDKPFDIEKLSEEIRKNG